MMMSAVEIIILIISALLLVVFFETHGFNVKSVIFSLFFLLPVLFFAVNMLTEVVTVDEPEYMAAITDIRNIKDMSVAEKLINQYKLSQLIIGSCFLAIPDSLINQVSTATIWAIYKTLHWGSVFALVLMIEHLIDKCLVRDEKNRCSIDTACLGALLGLPLACLLIKVTNYDALSTYFTVLGYVMLWSGIREDNRIYRYLSILMISLGIMEKSTNLPYWMFGILLLAFYEIKRRGRLSKKIAYGYVSAVLSVLMSVFSSVAYFGITYLLQDGFYREITLSDILYSFVASLGNVSSLFEKPAITLVCITASLPIMALILDGVVNLTALSKTKPETLLCRYSIGMICFIIVAGIISAYILPARVSPYLPIEEGYYSGGFEFNGAMTHFGAKTYLGHTFLKLCYACAVIMANYPLIVLGLFGGMVVIYVKSRYDDRITDGLLILAGLMTILFVFVLFDLPVDARYYSVPLLMAVIICIYYCGIYLPVFDAVFFRRIVVSLFVIYCIEMILYIPNVKVFSPMWLWHSEAYDRDVRKGVIHAGEAMLWGEEITVCGRGIEQIVEDEGSYSPEDIKVFSNYGVLWPTNPGFDIEIMDRYQNEFMFDDKTYYVLNKFKLYRDDIPGFIYKVTPVFTQDFKGEIGTWVYRGDQLEEYRDWFEE